MSNIKLEAMKKKIIELLYDTDLKTYEIESLTKELLDLYSVTLRDLLNKRLEENERNLNEAWENLRGESEFKNIDGISPFFNQVQLYKAKITELRCIIESL